MAPRRKNEELPTDVNGIAPIVIKDEATGPNTVVYRLICVAGPDLGRTFRLATPTVTIGRGPVDVALRAKDASREHARLFRRGTDYAIEDLGSANHTFVNGQQLRASVPLRSGDRIQVGADVFVFAHHDELEQRMHQLQRMESLATLAAGLAHDFNNSLSVILGGLELLERAIGPETSQHEMLSEMRSAATSASTLAQRLLRLGRHDEPTVLEPVDLAPLVQRTSSILRRQLPPNIRLAVDIPAHLVVRSSHEDLHQVIVNLILNARDAMPSGGALTFSAHRESIDPARAATLHLPQHGDYIVLTARDTGIGMDPDTLARAFEPFFTTKPPGHGTGLGLAMLHTVIRRHGGTVVAESTVGAGTRFAIWLPTAA